MATRDVICMTHGCGNRGHLLDVDVPDQPPWLVVCGVCGTVIADSDTL